MQRPFFVCRNQLFLELTVLPQPSTVLPHGESTVLPPPHGSNFYCCLGERYYRFGAVLPPSGTTVMRHGTTAPSSEHGGYDSGRGVPTPHTHSLISLPTSLSLLLKNGAGGPRRISVSGHSPWIPTGGIVPHHFLLPWTKVFPQTLFFLVVLSLLGFWGDACCS